MSTEEELVIPNLKSCLNEKLYHFQQQRYLCDVVVITANGFVPAHRIILVAGSQYFYDIEVNRNCFVTTETNFYLPHDMDDVRRVVDLLYTGKINVNEFNVIRIAKICDQLKLSPAVEKCKKYMKKRDIIWDYLQERSDETTPDVLSLHSNKQIKSETYPEDSQTNKCSSDSPQHTCTSIIDKNLNEDSTLDDVTETQDSVSESGENVSENSESIVERDQVNPQVVNEKERQEDDKTSESNSNDKMESSPPPSVPCMLFPINWKGLKVKTDAHSQMFLDIAELKEYEPKTLYTEEKITKEFDPDGMITAASEKEIERMIQDPAIKRVSCRVCHLEFTDRAALVEHRRTVHPKNFKREKYTCEICNSKLNNHVNVVEHKFKKHNIPYDIEKYPLFRCEHEDCEFTTIVSYKLREHKNSVHTEASHFCEHCNKAYKNKTMLRYHIETAHKGGKPSMMCNLCGRTFTTMQSLQNHMTIHTGNKKKLFCHLCTYSCIGKQELHNHLLKLHNFPLPKKTKIYKCDKCDYFTLCRSLYTRHQQLHNGTERIYKCSMCDKAFYNQHNVKAHEKRHKAETLNCPHEGCDFFTKFKHILRNHITGKHTNANFKPYMCHLCDHSCKLKGNLNKHLVNKHGLEVMTQAKQRKIAMETGTGYTELLKECAKSRIIHKQDI